MSIEKGRKIGFYTALALVIGAVIGVGIFFKNGSIGRSVNHDGLSWVTAWVLGGIIAAAAAFNFSTISSRIKSARSSGLGNWAEKTGGKKFGHFVRFNAGGFYYAIILFILGFFSSEVFFRFIQSVGNIDHLISITDAEFANGVKPIVPIYAHFILGLSFNVWFIIMNRVSLKMGGRIAKITTVLKFLPLFLAIVIGIILGSGSHTSVRPAGENANAFSSVNFQLKGTILALPAVLFAYDSFLNVGAITHKVKGGEKTVSRAIILGMLFVATIYTLIAVASGIHNQGDIASIISDSMPQSSRLAIEGFVYFFIFISAMGACNGVSISFTNEVSRAVETRNFFGTIKFIKKFGEQRTKNIYMTIILGFWLLITLIPSIIFDTDKFVDGISSFSAVFFFSIYFTIIFLYEFKIHIKIKKKTRTDIMHSISTYVALIGLSVVLILFIYSLIDDIVISKADNSWGLFAYKQGSKINALTTLFLWLIGLALFIGLPFLNLLLIKIFKTKEGLNVTHKKKVIEKYEYID